MPTYRFGNAQHTFIEVDRDEVGGTLIPVDPNNTDYAKLIAAGTVIEDYVEPPPVPPSNPTVIGIAELKIVDDEVSGIDTSTGLAAGMVIDVGVIWVFFLNSQPNTSYLTFVQSNGFNVDVTDRQEDYFEITVTDRSTNTPITPASLSISIQRVT